MLYLTLPAAGRIPARVPGLHWDALQLSQLCKALVCRDALFQRARRRFHEGTLKSTLEPQPTLRNAEGQLLSRVSGHRDPALSRESLGQFWKGLVNQHRDRPALIVRHEPQQQHEGIEAHSSSAAPEECLRWTFGEMDEHIEQLMRGLQDILRIKQGERVAVLMMNNSEMAALQIATARVGAIFVTLNPSYTAPEILRALNQVQASALFIVPALRSSNYLSALKSILPSLDVVDKAQDDSTLLNDKACPSLRRLVLVDNLTGRPKGWESESSLAEQESFRFADAMQSLNNRCIDYRALIRPAQRDSSKEADIACSEVINLQLTSGTTGSPKAVALSSHNLVNNGIMLGKVMRLSSSDVLANIPPLFHCFGLILGNLAAWSAGAAVVYPSEGFNPTRALRAASEEHATAIHGVPAHFVAELDVLRRIHKARDSLLHGGAWPTDLKVHPKEEWKFSLRTGFTSGSTVPIELMRSIMDASLLGAEQQTVVYGMTETSPVSFACDIDASIERRCQTVGQVAPHVEAKIVAPEDALGEPLPVGSVGELCTGGYIVMDGGYWNDEAKTSEVLQRHPSEPDVVWMRTGDLAKMDADGYTEICGRVKDLIIRGGENISAVGIENCIDTLPGVAGSAAVAVPDELMGEGVGVFIQASSTDSPSDLLLPAHVRAHVKKHLAGHCAPDWVWLLGDDLHAIPGAFPTTASGKVQKVVLRQWARKLASQRVGYAKSV